MLLLDSTKYICCKEQKRRDRIRFLIWWSNGIAAVSLIILLWHAIQFTIAANYFMVCFDSFCAAALVYALITVNKVYAVLGLLDQKNKATWD